MKSALRRCIAGLGLLLLAASAAAVLPPDWRVQGQGEMRWFGLRLYQASLWAPDGRWQAAALPAWAANTPKVSIQKEPQELYDARLEDDLAFAPAAVLYPAHGGPWAGLRPRDVALLGRKPHLINKIADIIHRVVACCIQLEDVKRKILILRCISISVYGLC